MTRICTRLAIVIIIISTLSACYKTAQTQYTSSTISYRFEEPREYCQRSMSDDGIQMQCMEGKINIKFESVDGNISPADFITQEYEIDDDYSWEEIEGKHSKVSLSIRNSDSSDEMIAPAYIAALQINESLFAIAEGFPVNGLENDFGLIFKNLIASFEPYQ